MHQLLREWHGEAILGAVLVAFQIYSVASVWQFRRSAIRVSGEVKKLIRYSKHISYYIAYAHAEATKVAEHCGPGPIATLAPGDRLDILIDPDQPPDVRIPEGSHVRWSRSSNCVPADDSVVSLADLLMIGLGIGLIVHGL